MVLVQASLFQKDRLCSSSSTICKAESIDIAECVKAREKVGNNAPHETTTPRLERDKRAGVKVGD
jgi:hypothetical protein